jgi:SAM-dependent methyltransferase
MVDQGADPEDKKTSYIQSSQALFQACQPGLATVSKAMSIVSVDELCRDIREHLFPQSKFIGAYEKAGVANGIPEEQWLYEYRSLIRGRVLNMSGSSHWNGFIYDLKDVDEVLVSDLSEEVVEKMGYETRVDVLGDFCADESPMEPGSVDTVLCLSILEHCNDPFQMIANLGQILRPGGRLFVMCPFAYTDGHLSPDNWRFCRDGYKLLAKKAGLEVLEIGEFGDFSSFASIQFGRVIGNQNNNGIPWLNWMICQKPS